MGLKMMKIRDANVYVNGTSTHGQASEIVLPSLNFSKKEYKTLGMVGTEKLFDGFEAMEVSIKWNTPENAVAIACANPFQEVSLMIRSSRDVYENSNLKAQEPVIYYVRGKSANINFGSLKPKDDTETETKLDVNYIKQIVNGQEICEIDVTNNIFRVGGSDMLTQYRKNLGI